jgi:hypothetical protein
MKNTRKAISVAEAQEILVAAIRQARLDLPRRTSREKENGAVVRAELDLIAQCQWAIRSVAAETGKVRRRGYSRRTSGCLSTFCEGDTDLARRVIDTGFKTLSKVLHPDKGGSPEAMAHLNAVNKVLRDALF